MTTNLSDPTHDLDGTVGGHLLLALLERIDRLEQHVRCLESLTGQRLTSNPGRVRALPPGRRPT